MNAALTAFLFFFFNLFEMKVLPFFAILIHFSLRQKTLLLVLASQESNDAPLTPFYGNTHITWSRMTEKVENSVILTIQKVESAFERLDMSGFKKSFNGALVER